MKGIRPRLAPYIVALLAVSGALLLTLLYKSLLTPTIFVLFFAAVAVSSWYGGFKTGLFATVLSSLAVSYVFFDPVFSLYVANTDSKVRLGLFILVTTFINWLNTELRLAKQRLELTTQQLQLSDARFRRLVESNIIGVIIADFNGAIAEANDAFLNMVGYTREDMLAGLVRWREMTPPEYQEISDRSIYELKTTGVCQHLEKEYIRKDGSRVPVLIGSALLDDHQKQVIGFVLDISKQQAALSKSHQILETLRQREEELRLITDSVPVLISYVDAQQRYRFNNKGYEELFGLSASETYGKHIIEILGESVYQSILPYIEIVMSGEQITFETQVHDKCGVIHDVSTTYVPRFSQYGQVEGFVALVTDVTERKQVEQEREQLLAREQAARSAAEAANRIKDEFLATLSHELRTPLNAILGWTQLLKTRVFNANTTALALETIERNSKSLAQLIEDILDVSQIIRGKLRLNTQPVDLIPIVEAAIDNLRPATEAKDICLEYQFDPTVGVVMGDANRLQQIVWNLVANAVKFTSLGGKVTVELDRLDTCVQIRISDTGLGISPEFLPYVFERFRQADGSTTRSHGGLGLGLGIVRHLVELHGGTVQAESPGIGQGATFIVNLPMKVVNSH
ncbi:sensor histidine kinase [Anabaena subtropica]|uniref:histidine kinase n=1 Tax=Anabaena subtropica FACHB-260 TaxID=2692884 RepID=A0ABR8CK59_9NOST|nr:PAS domain S-box protein [Anabaena subtropica]MBD2342674.1 PAS domain S-box protein [Anabaena subtropica FACHB-260]